jgi:hypothetical protein
MRLWTVHPQYLDARGLVALWREGLLAQKVLQGKTRGYRHHPQLARFRRELKPAAMLATYLWAVHAEATRRGYQFDESKILRLRSRKRMIETRGQLRHEWEHLNRKLQRRDPDRRKAHAAIARPRPHPLFRIVSGAVRDWERVGGQPAF